MLKLATKFAPTLACLETAYRAGFRHAELFLDAAIVTDWQTAARKARYYPFNYALHFPNRTDLTPDAVQGVVHLYRELGCKCMVMHEPMFNKFQRKLLELEPAICLAIENHGFGPDGFAEWAERSGALTLDVEHLWKFTLRECPLKRMLDNLRSFLDRYATKLKHVHLPGCWPGLDEHRPMYCAREMIFPVLSRLQEAGFDGLIVSEVTQEFQTPNDLRMDVLLFDTWRAEHDHVHGPSGPQVA